MKEKILEVDSRAKEYETIINDMIKPFCKDLEQEMLKIRQYLANEISNSQLDTSILELTNILYFAGNGQEIAGLKADISKEEKMKTISEAILNSEGTQQEKQAKAEIIAENDNLVSDIYNRAFRKLKLKVDLGLEMLNSMKKVLSKRITEMELTKSSHL